MKHLAKMSVVRGLLTSVALMAACTVPARELTVVDTETGGSGGSGPTGSGGGGKGGMAGSKAGSGGSAGTGVGGSTTGGSGGTGGTPPGSGGTAGSKGGTAGSAGSTGGAPPGTGGTTGGSAGKGGTAGTGVGGSAGTAGTAGTGGTGGTTPTCGSASPTGSTMCGPGYTCSLETCGPPATFTCYAAGTKAESASCTDVTECSSAMTCLGYKTAAGTSRFCKKQCTVDGDCGVGWRCTDATFCTAPNTVPARTCEKSCTDIVATTGCQTGFKCYNACYTGGGQLECGPAGTGKYNAACVTTYDCSAGYTCLNFATDGGSDGRCMQNCTTNANCTTGTCTGSYTNTCNAVMTSYKYCAVALTSDDQQVTAMPNEKPEL